MRVVQKKVSFTVSHSISKESYKILRNMTFKNNTEEGSLEMIAETRCAPDSAGCILRNAHKQPSTLHEAANREVVVLCRMDMMWVAAEGGGNEICANNSEELFARHTRFFAWA